MVVVPIITGVKNYDEIRSKTRGNHPLQENVLLPGPASSQAAFEKSQTCQFFGDTRPFLIQWRITPRKTIAERDAQWGFAFVRPVKAPQFVRENFVCWTSEVVPRWREVACVRESYLRIGYKVALRKTILIFIERIPVFGEA